MEYTFRCHQCDAEFDSFQSLASHKREELEAVDRLHLEHPEWDLKSCFRTMRAMALPRTRRENRISPAEAR